VLAGFGISGGGRGGVGWRQGRGRLDCVGGWVRVEWDGEVVHI